MQRHRFLTTSAGLAVVVGTALAGTAVAAPVASTPTVGTPTVATASSEQAVPAGFNSQFNGSKAGWSNVRGNWVLQPGVLYAKGIAAKRISTKHTNNYSDFYYAVRMHRRGNSTGIAANALVLRGNPSKLDTLGEWKPSYLFQYTNLGYVSVWKISPTGTATSLLDWTTTSVVVGNGYNTVEVWATDDSFDFHINGTHIWAGSDSSVSFGQVGVSVYTEPGKTSETRLDWAKLTTIGPRTEAKHVDAPLGKTVRGGSIDRAPTVR